MIEMLLTQLTRDARMQRAVAGSKLDNGIQLFAYPLEQGVLIAIGIGAGRLEGESFLQKRAQDMARFGAWLPAQFNDGSWYVLRRFVDMDDDACLLSEDEFLTAAELLA